LIEAVSILDCVLDRESRIDTHEDGCIAAGLVQIDQQRSAGLAHGTQHGRDVHRDRRRADPAFGAYKANDLAEFRTCRVSSDGSICSFEILLLESLFF
jgi:hypothetical protein